MSKNRNLSTLAPANTSNFAVSTNASITGTLNTSDVNVTGNLVVTGTTVSVNVATLDVKDLNITVAKGATTNAAANGAGITVDPSNAQLFYTSSDNSWNINRSFNINSGGGAFGTGAFFTSNGFVGIGTNAPLAKLHVQDGAGTADNATIRIDVMGGNAGDYSSLLLSSVNAYGLGEIRSYVETSYLSNMRFYTAESQNVLTERMRIDSAGRVGIGGSTTQATFATLAALDSTKSNAAQIRGTVGSSLTSTAIYVDTGASTAAASFTLGTLSHYRAFSFGFGAGSAVTNQYGFLASSALTGATNNYGFYGDIASGTGRYNFYAAGTADNYFAGSVGIGVTPQAGRTFTINKNITGATGGYASLIAGQVQSDVTFAAYYVSSFATTAAASFTLGSLIHFNAQQSTFGAGSTVTNQYGFYVDNSLIGAINDYGFFSNIANGTGRWNFYANGTAPNYFAGNMGIGTTTLDGNSRLTIAKSNSSTVNPFINSTVWHTSLQNTDATNGNSTSIQNLDSGGRVNSWMQFINVDHNYASAIAFGTSTSGAANYGERMRIATNGNVGIGTSSPNSRLEVINATGGTAIFAGNANGNIYVNFNDTGVNYFSGSANIFRNGAGTTEFVRIDNSGNVGIGTNSPTAKLDLYTASGSIYQFIRSAGSTGSDTAYYRATAGSSSIYNIMYGTGVGYTYSDTTNQYWVGTSAAAPLILYTNNAERMRIVSGGQVVTNGVTVRGRSTLYWDSNTEQGLVIMTTSSTFNGSPVVFYNGAAGLSGFIGQSGGAVTYNSSSDYRLKENVKPLENSLFKVTKLNPVSYTWKIDGIASQGFLAHEVQEVVPEAITGEKDAMNEDGTIKSQSIDMMRLVPLLTAAIQELKAELDAVKAELNTLKGA